MFDTFFREIKNHKLLYKFVGVVLLLATFIRVYRTDQILGFWYDQGRDALVIWDFIHSHKFFLIGPTTGIEGVFRGPWYYWLITPFYFLGNGNPVWPAVFLALTTVVAIFLLFKLAYKYFGLAPAIVTLLISSFSFQFMTSARWLSNPTPMYLISVGLLWSVYKVLDYKNWWWVGIGFSLGMAMQFGSAAEVFYFPAISILFLWIYFKDKKAFPTWPIFIVSAAIFFSIFMPQVIFDLKHDHVLSNAISRFLTGNTSKNVQEGNPIILRLKFYFNVLFAKLFDTNLTFQVTSFVLFLLGLFINFKKLSNKYFLATLLLLFSPLIGFLFFQGNYGTLYDYYFTGYYLIFCLIVSVILGKLAEKNGLGLVIVTLFLILFLTFNLPEDKNYAYTGIEGSSAIYLGNELQTVDWVYKTADGRPFNVDTYVPPVITYSYNYLYLWLGNTKYGYLPETKLVPLLFTPYEADPVYYLRVAAWIKRQDGIGRLIDQKTFGGITAQERLRIQ